MTTRDISEQVKNLYDVEISAEMASNITNRIIPVVAEWQNRQPRGRPFMYNLLTTVRITFQHCPDLLWNKVYTLY